jgi:uridine kinase
MKGDSIVIEAHHRKAAAGIVPLLLPVLEQSTERRAVSIAGQSGSGKSETAAALAEALAQHDIGCVILQQDDYFVYPPKTNDLTRRADIGWVGPQEVRLDLMDGHVRAFLDGAVMIEKPLVDYETDSIGSETMAFGEARVLIAEGTYTTLLEHCRTHVFIDRTYLETRAHREKRMRDASELDPFIDRVLEIEHGIISSQKGSAQIIVDTNYNAFQAATAQTPEAR